MASYTHYIERLESMKTERESYIPHWKDLSEHFLTRQARFTTTERNRGEKRNQKIINEAGVLALRTLSSGMMSGMTNPARPWVQLKTPDPDLNKFRPVKIWLGIFRDRMMELMLRSNLYTTFPLVYKDLGCYGTMAYLMLPDEESMFRSYHYPIGSYVLACDDRGRIDTCYREFEMTARQMVRKFGAANCSETVKKLAQQSSGKEIWIQVVHAIERNEDYDPRKSGLSYYKAFKSCYFEYDKSVTHPDKLLKESGFDHNPIIAGRWDVNGEDIYGSSPGMEALGTTRQLQFREKRKAQLVDRGTNPPMGAPASMKNKRSSVLPGDVTYYEQSPTGQKFEPLYQIHPGYYEWVLEDIKSCTERVRRAFFEDLFLMMANDFRSNITAREIAERHEEKLLQLGPVLLRQNDEHYDPLIEWISSVMFEHEIVPPAPPELQGMAINVEYVSTLAQAMKMIGISNIERFTGYVGQVGTAKPDAADLFDEDKAVIHYADALNVPEDIIRDEKVVAQMRQERKVKMAQMQAAAGAVPAAETAKTLSETDMRKDSALSRITNYFTGGGAQQ